MPRITRTDEQFQTHFDSKIDKTSDDASLEAYLTFLRHRVCFSYY